MDASANDRSTVREQAADWALRLETAPQDAALRREFQEWLAEHESHRTAYDKIQRVSAIIERRPRSRVALARSPETPENAPGRIVTSASSRQKSHRGRWLAAGAALAAACLAFVLFPLIQRQILADYVTGVAELREVALPDGSVAWLDAGSAIAVDYSDARRTLTLLSGQAFFEVIPNRDRPFEVDAKGLSVVVTGTSFGVRIAPQTVSVEVRTGSVEVAVPGTQALSRLTVGESLVYDRQMRSVSRGEIAPGNVALWRSRRLIVESRPFDETLDEIGRHVPGVIVVRNGELNRKRVSGLFDLSNPSDALQALVGAHHAHLTRITPYLVIVSAD